MLSDKKKHTLKKSDPCNISHGFYMKQTNLGCFWLDLRILFPLQFSLTSTLFDVGDYIKYLKIV